MQMFLLVRKSQNRKFLSWCRQRKSANFWYQQITKQQIGND